MLYARGILVHCAVWLVSCILHPFIWSGLSRHTTTGLMATPFVFGFGLPFLLLGSAVWMAPFLVPSVRRYSGVAYHLWVALGGGMAVLCASKLGPLGDPLPTINQRFTPTVLALAVAALFSLLSDRWLRRLQGLSKQTVERLASSVRHVP